MLQISCVQCGQNYAKAENPTPLEHIPEGIEQVIVQAKTEVLCPQCQAQVQRLTPDWNLIDELRAAAHRMAKNLVEDPKDLYWQSWDYAESTSEPNSGRNSLRNSRGDPDS